MKNAKLRKLEKIEEQIAQLTNEKKMVKQAYNEEVRKARTHRICKRGGLIEKILPETIEFTDEQFKGLLETLLTSGFAQKRIAEISGKNSLPDKPTSKKEPEITSADTDEDGDEGDGNSDPVSLP